MAKQQDQNALWETHLRCAYCLNMHLLSIFSLKRDGLGENV